jgi:hypothetical protein
MTTDLEHTNQPDKCLAGAIKVLAEDCDHEYYMSAIEPPSGTLERAKRGRFRILEGIIELERMNREVSCSACRQEIKRQINHQREGLLEIERVWKLFE